MHFVFWNLKVSVAAAMLRLE